jgi:hypothetical protein
MCLYNVSIQQCVYTYLAILGSLRGGTARRQKEARWVQRGQLV